MKRNQVNEIDKWDLTLLFADDSAWKTALETAQSAISDLPSLKDTMTASADELYRTVRTIVEVGEQVDIGDELLPIALEIGHEDVDDRLLDFLFGHDWAALFCCSMKSARVLTE